MPNFIKIILFLIVAAGIGIYFFVQSPEIFKMPSFESGVLKKIFPQPFAPKTNSYAPSYPPSYLYSPTFPIVPAVPAPTISGE
ncbi:MAG: hypothetical protein Q8N28_01265 [bacterium]|nr:hypothetical protein [bacterium]